MFINVISYYLCEVTRVGPLADHLPRALLRGHLVAHSQNLLDRVPLGWVDLLLDLRFAIRVERVESIFF